MCFGNRVTLFAVHHAVHLYHIKLGQAELTAGMQHLPNSQSWALQVIDLILLYDGDVMKFAGDSMIVAFSPSSEEQAAADGGLKEATLRCMHCASDLVDKYGELLPTHVPTAVTVFSSHWPCLVAWRN